MTVRLQIDIADHEYRKLLAIANEKKTQVHRLIEAQVHRALGGKPEPRPDQVVPRKPKGRSVWTPDHDVQLLALYHQGLSDYDIAKQLDVDRTTVLYHRAQLGLPTRFGAGRPRKHEGGRKNDEAVPVLRAAGADPTDQLDRDALGFGDRSDRMVV